MTLKNKSFQTIAIVLTILAAAFWLAADHSAVSTASASQPAQTKAVPAEGELVPASYATVGFQISGIVAEILVTEGAEVKAGDELMSLDVGEAEVQVAQAQARVNSAEIALKAAEAQLQVTEARLVSADQQIASAEANLALILADPLPEEVEAAEKQIAAAQAEISRAVGQQNTILTAVTQSQIDNANAQLLAAQAQAQVVQDRYQDVITTCFDTPEGEVCPLLGPVEEQTRAQVEAAQSQVGAAQALLNQLQAGPTNGQRVSSQGGVTMANAQLQVAEAQLALLLAPPAAEQIKIAEVAIEQAKAAKGATQAAVLQAEASVKMAQSALSMAQLDLETQQLALEKYLITAPMDGTVSQITIKEGNIVNPGTSVVTVADFSGWKIETTDLTELDIPFVAVGDSANISIDALPNAAVSGTVEAIAVRSSISQGDVVYEVTIAPEPLSNLPLRWGMTTFVSING